MNLDAMDTRKRTNAYYACNLSTKRVINSLIYYFTSFSVFFTCRMVSLGEGTSTLLILIVQIGSPGDSPAGPSCSRTGPRGCRRSPPGSGCRRSRTAAPPRRPAAPCRPAPVAPGPGRPLVAGGACRLRQRPRLLQRWRRPERLRPRPAAHGAGSSSPARSGSGPCAPRPRWGRPVGYQGWGWWEGERGKKERERERGRGGKEKRR